MKTHESTKPIGTANLASTASLSQANHLAEEIGELIREKFLADPGEPDDDLVNSGVVDSLTLIQLLVHLEERFNVTIPLSELEIDDIRSISSLARLVANRRVAVAAVVAR